MVVKFKNIDSRDAFNAKTAAIVTGFLGKRVMEDDNTSF
jgi:hypothetical protein